MSEVVAATAQATPTAEATATSQTAEATASTAAATTETTQAATPQATSEAQPAVPAVPEKYELKLPEGSTLDQSAIDRVSAYAKEMKLSQDMAQAVLDREHLAVDSYAKALDSQFAAVKEEWKQNGFKDKEIGGDAYRENAELAKRVVAKYASEEFAKILDESGYGNHPELIRTFLRIGKAMAEDKLVMPGAQAGGKKSAEELFYGKQ